MITELLPRLEDHKYRWELHSYGLAEGYDKLVVSEIIALLIEALKGIGVADNNLLGRTSRPRATIPPAPAPPDQPPPHPQCRSTPDRLRNPTWLTFRILARWRLVDLLFCARDSQKLRTNLGSLPSLCEISR